MEDIIIAPQEGKQSLAMNLKADIIFFGGAAGSGKSRLILMKALQYMEDGLFNCIYFRKTIKNLEGAGGLWPEGKKLYSPFSSHVREQAKEIIFPSGFKVHMTYLDRDEDCEKNHQGLQYGGVFFDELTHFTQYSFLYLVGRMRSASDNDSFCMASCNPSPDSWVLRWVEWYLDEDGYPREDLCGTVRYFVIVNDQPIFADTEEELAKAYPHICYNENPLTGNMDYIPPMSFAFINGTIYDNPALIAANPKYLTNLKAQTEVNRARLLDGNWYARAEGANYFKRDWLQEADSVPSGCTRCRAWDKAGTKPNDLNRNPDYTAGSPMFHKSREGDYYLTWDFLESLNDGDNEKRDAGITGRFRELAGKRDKMMIEQAREDGESCRVVLPLDPAQAGKSEYAYSAKRMGDAGFLVFSDPMPGNKSKLTRAQPFFNACENGYVYIVKSSFPNEATYDAYMAELEKFDGEPSTAMKKDDWTDATASGFNYMHTIRVVKIVKRNQNAGKTALSEYKQSA